MGLGMVTVTVTLGERGKTGTEAETERNRTNRRLTQTVENCGFKSFRLISFPPNPLPYFPIFLGFFVFVSPPFNYLRRQRDK